VNRSLNLPPVDPYEKINENQSVSAVLLSFGVKLLIEKVNA